MASRCNASIALFLCINILFFSLVSSSEMSPSPEPEPEPKPTLEPVPVPVPKPAPTPAHTTPLPGKCPRNALKLSVCADIFKIVNGVVVGAPLTRPCCSLLKGLINLEAAVCLCTAIKANLLGIKLNIPLNLSLVLKSCARQAPTGFECT